MSYRWRLFALHVIVLHFIVSQLLGAGSASAASRGHQNRCSDATRELRGATSRAYENRDVAPGEAQGAIAHLNQHIERLNRATRMMDSAGPWDAKDPDLRECVELMQRARAYIEATTTKIKAAEALGTKVAPIMEAAKGEERRRAFFLLSAVVVEPKARAFENLTPAQARTLVDALGPVADACRSALPDAAKAPPALPARQPGGNVWRVGGTELPGMLDTRAEWWCFVAERRMELAGTAIGNVFVTAERYGNHQIAFEEILRAGDRWSGSADGWVFDIARDERPFFAGLKTALAAWYAAFQLAVPEQPFAGLAQDIGRVREAVAAAAGRNKVTAGADHDKAMEASAKAAAAKLYPKVAVPATWMDAGAWTVEQNALGVPLRRFRSGQVVYRVGADPWCLQRTFNWVEPHMGGGKYAKAPGAALLPGVRVVTCP